MRCLAEGLICVQVWRFLKQRIEIEEHHLLDFLGMEYAAYASETPTRIPFIP